MGRAIEQENSFFQVLLKLIPSEIIAVFVFIQGVMPAVFLPHLVVAIILVAITPVYLSRAAGVESRPQLVISTLSLAIWIYAMGMGPLRFVRAPYYEPWHGAVALALWTLVPPMFLMRPPASRLARQSAARQSTARKPGRGAPRQPQRRRSSAKVSK